MKPGELVRTLTGVLTIVCLIVGTLCLGLGLSVLGYINHERAGGHLAPSFAVQECTALFVVGAFFCLAGIVLRVFR